MTDYWTVIDYYADLLIAGCTFIGCLYLAPLMLYWWWKLRRSHVDLRPLVLSIAVAKFGVGVWALSQLVAISAWKFDLPTYSLPARCAILIGIAIQVWVTSKIRSASKIETLNGSFEKGNGV